MATKAQHTENNGRDIIAQSHHATVLRTQKRVIYPFILRDNVWRTALSQQCKANLADSLELDIQHVSCDCLKMLLTVKNSISYIYSFLVASSGHWQKSNMSSNSGEKRFHLDTPCVSGDFTSDRSVSK